MAIHCRAAQAFPCPHCESPDWVVEVDEEGREWWSRVCRECNPYWKQKPDHVLVAARQGDLPDEPESQF